MIQDSNWDNRLLTWFSPRPSTYTFQPKKRFHPGLTEWRCYQLFRSKKAHKTYTVHSNFSSKIELLLF